MRSVRRSRARRRAPAAFPARRYPGSRGRRSRAGGRARRRRSGTATARPAPAALAIDRSCIESPTTTMSDGVSPVALQNPCTMPGPGFSPCPPSKPVTKSSRWSTARLARICADSVVSIVDAELKPAAAQPLEERSQRHQRRGRGHGVDAELAADAARSHPHPVHARRCSTHSAAISPSIRAPAGIPGRACRCRGRSRSRPTRRRARSLARRLLGQRQGQRGRRRSSRTPSPAPRCCGSRSKCRPCRTARLSSRSCAATASLRPAAPSIAQAARRRSSPRRSGTCPTARPIDGAVGLVQAPAMRNAAQHQRDAQGVEDPGIEAGRFEQPEQDPGPAAYSMKLPWTRTALTSAGWPPSPRPWRYCQRSRMTLIDRPTSSSARARHRRRSSCRSSAFPLLF